MSRDLTSGMLAEITAAQLTLVMFCEAEFATGTLRLWSGIAPIDWDGQTWTGAGNLLSISEIKETGAIEASGITMQLSGMNQSVLSAALGQAQQGLPGKVWLGALDANNEIVEDPFLCFEGRLDVPDITDDGATCTVRVSYESRLIDLERARERRITHEDLQIDFPGDLGHEFVAGLQDKSVVW